MTPAAIVAVDGGGTKTSVAVALPGDATPRVIGRATAGPSNPLSVGEAAATDTVAAAIAAALDDADLGADAVAAVCLCLAGVGRPDQRRRVLDWATTLYPAAAVHVGNDAQSLPYALSSTGVGMGLIAGTGSLLVARDAQGVVRRCGGWGPLLGDEGSGYAIGLAALRAAARMLDHRDPTTGLLDTVMKHVAAGHPDQFVPQVYHGDLDRSRIAALARDVFDLSAAGDVAAQRIVDQAADAIGQMVIDFSMSLPAAVTRGGLVITGSVLVHQSAYRDRMLASIRAAGVALGPVVTLADPLHAMLAHAASLV